jgi:hypothetical protein
MAVKVLMLTSLTRSGISVAGTLLDPNVVDLSSQTNITLATLPVTVSFGLRCGKILGPSNRIVKKEQACAFRSLLNFYLLLMTYVAVIYKYGASNKR